MWSGPVIVIRPPVIPLKTHVLGQYGDFTKHKPEATLSLLYYVTIVVIQFKLANAD